MNVFHFVIVIGLTACSMSDGVTPTQMAAATKLCAQYGGVKQVDIKGALARAGLMNVTCNNGASATLNRYK